MSSVEDRHDALAAERLAWDSEFWGFPVARISARGDSNRIDDGDQWCRNHNIAVAYLSLPADAVGAATTAVQLGFEIVDIRIVFRVDNFPETPLPTGIRPARPEDLPALREIARTAHRGMTRFYADPHFPLDRCDAFYETWITNSVQGWADFSFVADDGAGPVGYATGHVDRAARVGNMGILAVHAEERGSGIGRRLLEATKAQYASLGLPTQRYATQGRNEVTMALLAKVGCAVREVGLSLHKWYRQSPSERG